MAASRWLQTSLSRVLAVLLISAGAAACLPGPAAGQPTGAGAGTVAPDAIPPEQPERSKLRLGMSISSVSFLPIYHAAEWTYPQSGLEVEIVAFNNPTALAQALAADSVDVAVGSLNLVVNSITADQPVRAFYGGINKADYEWLAASQVRSWSELKGKSLGISTLGSVTDVLTRHALRKNGLEPGRDVNVVQLGSTPAAFQALQAGRIDAAILQPPFNWQAGEAGFTRLGAQLSEVSDEWPKNLYFAKQRTIEDNPATIRALLRATVRAIRLARSDRDGAIQTIVNTLKYDRPYAARAYDELVDALNERGALPARSMPVFWEITTGSGEVSEPWPENRYFDRRFVDTFAQWAP